MARKKAVTAPAAVTEEKAEVVAAPVATEPTNPFIDRKERSAIWAKRESGWEAVQHVYAVNAAGWIAVWRDREKDTEFVVSKDTPE